MLDGAERLELIQSQLRRALSRRSRGTNCPTKAALRTKDLIAPSVLDFKPEGAR